MNPAVKSIFFLQAMHGLLKAGAGSAASDIIASIDGLRLNPGRPTAIKPPKPQ